MTAAIVFSDVVGKVPTSLVPGQIALNRPDRKIYYQDNSSSALIMLDIGNAVTLAAMNTAIATAINNLESGAPVALSTLKELADAIGDDANFAATITAALGFRVRYDAAQTLTGAQLTQVLANIGLSNVNNTSDANKPVSTAQAAADTLVLNNAKAYTDQQVATISQPIGTY